ncbi:SRPBCC domain-containing protein [Terrabacter sp. MAHUQ-38]|uniref:SRPBCC domain-containing protein n=1 Tax=unclassified Terrabacter TaxID=2630222 RepID=UPI00165D9411|nr:SRPBCC domain-containing protein [Terrabacter sp. MAHUQ-38]MBC9822108.1 SRPBCC domain-containing protein [Terrabacter sp. MAHUQ-38]
MTGHIARAEVIVDAKPNAVWDALTDPEQVRAWMVGTTVTTDWQAGSPITWQGEMNGKPYEDKGEVLEAEAPSRLSMTHYSPLMGQEDRPENYHTVTYTLTPTRDGRTTVALEQDGNESAEQAEQFSQNWQSMLESLKQTAEKS